MSSSLMSTYARADVAFVRGEGAWLEDQQGRRYLDFGSGVAVNALGHAHPHLIQALTEQAQQLWHTSNLFQMPEGERLARRLCEATFADRVFFTNSGAEALECTIKLVRKYHHSKGQSQKWRIITFEGAFHGRTLATLAAGGQKKYLEGFGPPVTGFDQVPFGDHEALKAAITPETAGILVEPIQGEGGIRPVPPVCLRGLRELCDHHGLLLAFDEVQTGVGRTGTFLAYEASGITPDVVALAKGLGGGFPVGACLATEDAASGMTTGTHGSTFGGNPLAMAVGNAVLDIVLADQFLQDVRDKSLYLRQHLAEVADRHPDIIQEVRGQGFLMGVKVHPLNTDVVTAARAQGLITIAAGDNVVRLLPPLIISKEDIKEGVERLAAACVALKQNSTLTS